MGTKSVRGGSARVVFYRGGFVVLYGAGRYVGRRTFDDVRDALAFVTDREIVRVVFEHKILP
jgi:hypothetical protein